MTTKHHTLPVFDQVLSSPFDLADVAEAGETVLHRAVRIGRTPDSVRNLDDLLELGEHHFAALTRAGLPVVPHEWGLTPTSSVPERRRVEFIDYSGQCLPDGYFLAAEVAVIQPYPIPHDPTLRTLPLTATSRYRQSEVVGQTGCQLVEIGSMFGAPVSAADNTKRPAFWMQDIDLYFKEA